MIELLFFLVCLHCNIYPGFIKESTANYVWPKKLFTHLAYKQGFTNKEISRVLKTTTANVTRLNDSAKILIKIDEGFKRKYNEIEENLENSNELLKEYQRVFHAKKIRTFQTDIQKINNGAVRAAAQRN